MGIFDKIKQANTKGHLSTAASRAAHGSMLSSRFFKKHFFQTSFFVFMVMVYISNRYDCITGMETIAQLQTDLAVAKTELQQQRSSYMSSTRESAMQALVDTMHLGLNIQERPPYQIPNTNDR